MTRCEKAADAAEREAKEISDAWTVGPLFGEIIVRRMGGEIEHEALNSRF